MNQRKCRMFSVLNEEQPASWPHLPLRPLLAVRLAWDVSIKIAERNCLETLPYINRSVLKKRAACIGTMQNKWGLGTAQQAFCNAKMAFVYTDALLATMVLVLRSSHIDEAGILQASKQSRLYSYIFPKFFDRRYSSGERPNCFLNTAANFPWLE